MQHLDQLPEQPEARRHSHPQFLLSRILTDAWTGCITEKQSPPARPSSSCLGDEPGGAVILQWFQIVVVMSVFCFSASSKGATFVRPGK